MIIYDEMMGLERVDFFFVFCGKREKGGKNRKTHPFDMEGLGFEFIDG